MADMQSPETDRLSVFKKAMDEMIAKNGKSWNESFGYTYLNNRIKDYSKEEVQQIINSGSLLAQQKLSRNFFYKDGLYKRILIYYAI